MSYVKSGWTFKTLAILPILGGVLKIW